MDHIYQNIPGFFNYEHVYLKAVEMFPSDSHFVEVGVWYGTSASFMAVEIANSGKKIKFDCVDTWKGSVEHANNEDVKNGTLYEAFLNYTKPVADYITPVRTTSLEAANLYADESLDFVFIDASHDYENVLADIKAWYPKLKKTGMFAGHDYTNCEDVAKAVEDFFGLDPAGHRWSPWGTCWVWHMYMPRNPKI